MDSRIRLSAFADFSVKMFMFSYNKSLKAAESYCQVPDKKYGINLYMDIYNSIVSQCKKFGIDIHSIDLPPKYIEYIHCVETFDKVVREKLSVNYEKICETAREEFENKIVDSFKHEFMINGEYRKWLTRFSGVREATNVFLNEIEEDDTASVKAMQAKASVFSTFLKEADSRVQAAKNAFEEKRRIEREEAQRKAAEAQARIEQEKLAREKARQEELERKAAAERAERERLAAIERRRIELKHLVDEIMPVEGKNLDTQQVDCITDESHNALVIAGAGSGKTTTIIGKVKYLLHTGKCSPEEILLLSFTKKSADEMKTRIKAETGIDMGVSTFHKLGLDTITHVESRKPTIYAKSLQFFAQEDIQKYLGNRYYRAELLKYCWLNPPRARSVFDFKTKEEMFEYNGSTPTVTIQGEYVKSVCELEIANFLFRNRIRYSYEKPYKFNTANGNYSGYKPDFYLEDYDIYVEFFAVDRNGNVPKWFEARHGKTARQAYHDGIEWKRNLHRSHRTKLVEVSYADRQNDKLLETLQEKLSKLGVQFNSMTDEELYKCTERKNRFTLSDTANIIGNIISLVKANGYTYDYFEKVNKLPQNDSIIKLAKPIARDYEQMLKDTNQIDFNDMIYRAAKYYHFGRAAHCYKYVIVDEYQDISKARCELLKEMRTQGDFSLFCVGDDWQSIYRFAGSDVGYMLDFEKYWGETAKYKIETTYRFPQEILNASGKFVMRNPAQIKKQLRTANNISGKVGYIFGDGQSNPHQLADKLQELPQDSTVFLIGRYTDDKDILNYKDSPFSIRFSTVDNKFIVSLNERPDLDIEFLTAHKSKGLQADYVFILNNKRNGMGFPSRIHNEPVINFLLRKGDDFLFSEERRLFYVALTRAKREVWLLVDSGNCSSFVTELRTGLRIN